MKRTSKATATAAYLFLTSSSVSSFVPNAIITSTRSSSQNALNPGINTNRPLTWSAGPLQLSSGKGFDSSPDDASATPTPATQPKKSTGMGGGQFELQEMRFQLSAMKKAGVSARNLNPEKKAEIAQYVREVLLRIPSPVPLKALADKDRLVGKWTKTIQKQPILPCTSQRTAGIIPSEIHQEERK